MHPILLQVGSYELKSYTALAIAAMIGAMVPAYLETSRLRWPVREAMVLAVQCTVLGFVASHVLYAFTRLDLPWSEWWLMFWRFNGGNVWFGGFLASWGLCRWWARRKGIPGLQMDDVAAFAVLIANPTGRIGCFLNGCCYGKPTNLPWGIWLNTREWGLAHVHPVQLYEMFYQYALFAVLWKLRLKNRYNGQTAVRYLIFMPLGRFLLEFLRGDTIRGFVAGWLSTSQFIALGLMAAGVAMHFYVRARPTPARPITL